MSRIILFLCILLPFNSITADNYLFKQFSVSENFPTSIQTICAEKNGYVWIGSGNKVGRFDGNELKIYSLKYKKDFEQSLNNKVNLIVEDSLCNIWVLSTSGLRRYNPEKDSFDTYKDQQGKDIIAFSAYHLPEGMLFGTQNQLFIYNYKQRTLTKYLTLQTDINFTINQIWQWDQQTLLCNNTWQGPLLVDIRTGMVRPSPFMDTVHINQTLTDNKGRIWCGSYNKGIFCFDKQGRIVAQYNTSNKKMNCDIVLCMVEYKGSIWAGTDGGGINIIDMKTGKTDVIKHLNGNKNSLPTNSIQCLYINDRYIWAGSTRGGLINIQESPIHSYTDAPMNGKYGLSERATLSLYQENNSNVLWIGTDDGGINSFNPNSCTFTHYPQTWGKKITSICGYNENKLLVSIFSEGLLTFDKRTGRLEPLPIKNTIIGNIVKYGRKPLNLYQEKTGSILLLSASIYKYHPADQSIEQVSDSSFRCEGVLSPITHDQHNTYLHDWRNIYVLSSEDNRISPLYSASNELINCVISDCDSGFWIGTDFGVKHFNMKDRKITSIPHTALIDVKALSLDCQRYLWIGTDCALFAWQFANNSLLQFGDSDGAIPNEYRAKAAWRSNDGNIYMGGVNGLVHIRPDFPKVPSEEPRLTLAEMTANGKKMPINAQLPIELANEDKNLSLKIMTWEKDILRRKDYKFRISGKNEQVIESKVPELNLYSLESGTYHLSASCNTKDGRWTPFYPILTFSILPPWYQSWWFITLCVVILASVFTLGLIVINNKKKNALQIAMRRHIQQVYEEKVRFLININHELRTPLTLIYTPLNQILNHLRPDDKMYPPLKNIFKQSQRMKELLNMVLNLRKMEVGESKLDIQLYPLNQWIRDLGMNYSYEEDEKQLHIRYELSPKINLVGFDKNKNAIILTNLVNNAFKHSPQGGEITLRTELTDDGHFVRISVIDQGKGVEEANIDKLFTRFYQGQNEEEGYGIGLQYAKTLVEQHGGKIGVYNYPGAGACFFYDLPLRTETGQFSCPPKEYLSKLLTDKEDIKIKYIPDNNVDLLQYSLLFVDDNKDLRNFIKKNLTGHFKKLYIASNGKEAYEIACKAIPDIIISDVMMPDMNGYELCGRIKENLNISHIIVILLTARTDKQSYIDGNKVGADAYIEKPFEIEIVMETVRNRLLTRKRLRDKYVFGTKENEREASLGETEDAFLERLNKIIENNMETEKLNIPFICQEMSISRATLYNKLKSAANMGANEYINKQRIEKAVYLIEHSNLNFAEIADKIGFATQRYFSSVFKLYTGKSPKQYKESLQK